MLTVTVIILSVAVIAVVIGLRKTKEKLSILDSKFTTLQRQCNVLKGKEIQRSAGICSNHEEGKTCCKDKQESVNKAMSVA